MAEWFNKGNESQQFPRNIINNSHILRYPNEVIYILTFRLCKTVSFTKLKTHGNISFINNNNNKSSGINQTFPESAYHSNA